MPSQDNTSVHRQEQSNWGIVDMTEISAAEADDAYKKTAFESEAQTEHFGLREFSFGAREGSVLCPESAEFDAGGYKFSCKVFFAPQFAQVREKTIDPQDFVESLARCVKWNASGGKSGSAFLKTRGMRRLCKLWIDGLVEAEYFHR